MKRDIIKEKSLSFSLRAIELCQTMLAHDDYQLTNRLLDHVTQMRTTLQEANASIGKRDSERKWSAASRKTAKTSRWIHQVAGQMDGAAHSLMTRADELHLMLKEYRKTMETSNKEPKYSFV